MVQLLDVFAEGTELIIVVGTALLCSNLQQLHGMCVS
jgi:hypothetical protein